MKRKARGFFGKDGTACIPRKRMPALRGPAPAAAGLRRTGGGKLDAEYVGGEHSAKHAGGEHGAEYGSAECSGGSGF